MQKALRAEPKIKIASSNIECDKNEQVIITLLCRNYGFYWNKIIYNFNKKNSLISFIEPYLIILFVLMLIKLMVIKIIC